MLRALLLALLALPALTGQTPDDIDACEAPEALLQVYYKAKGSPDRLKILGAALQENPSSLFLNYWRITSPEIPLGSLSPEYKKKLDEHPGDPLYLFLYATSLTGADSAKAIDLFKQAIEKDPKLVQAHVGLIGIYSYVMFDDRARLTQSLRAWQEECPGDVSISRFIIYVDDLAVMRELAAQLRKAIEARDTVGVANTYGNLWRAEARLNGGNDPAQIRKDMERIRKLDPDNIDRSRSLSQGYRLLGEAEPADEIAASRAHGTFQSEYNTWASQHGNITEARRTPEYLAVTADWVTRFPDNAPAWFERLSALAASEKSSAEELGKAGDGVMAAGTRAPSSTNPYSLQVAEVWLERGVRLPDVARLAKQAVSELGLPIKPADDRLKSVENAEAALAFARTQAWRTEIDAYRGLKDFPAARAALAEMKTWADAHQQLPGPTNIYHLESARVAEDAGDKQEALDQYRQAWPDEATSARARALWNSLGKSPAAFEAWWKRD